MGKRNYRGTKDNRSKRDSRAPGFDQLIMRMLPREPIRPAPTLAIDTLSVTDLLLRLPVFLREVEDELDRRVQHTASDCQFHTFIDELAGLSQRRLLCHGAYVISESGHLRRVLYVGGAAATMVRHRITDHLAFRGGKRMMLRELRHELQGQLDLSHRKEGTRLYELALLRALFSRHRWSDIPQVSLTEQQRYAVDIIATGAFEITCVAFPSEDRLLARALEMFFDDRVLWENRKRPPLNALPVSITEESLQPNSADCITMPQLARIVARVKDAALVL